MYNKPEHVMCCWQRVTTGPVPYVEKTWLEYGEDYAVTRIEKHDTGGILSLLVTPPPGVQQLFIRRRTPRTQEVDLHNGARLTAELIEGMGDKATMEIQELSEQVLQKDDLNELRKVMNDAVVAEEDARKEADEAEAAERKEADQDLLREIEAEARARREADEAEARAREAADSAEAQYRREAIDAEAEIRKAADAALHETVSSEAEARREEDSKLWDAVNIGIDEHIQEYFEENADAYFEARGAIPAGGTAGQILEKASDEDYDTRWADKPAGGGEGSGGGEEGGGNTGGEGGINLADIISADANNALALGSDEKLYVPESSGAGGGEGSGSGGGPVYPAMGSATFIIGNRDAGHALNNVDYLCNGTDDHIVINNAIEALPAGGGKIIIREGKYNLGGSIIVNRDNVTLQGMGASTELNAVVDIQETSGIIKVPKSHCKIADLKLKNDPKYNVCHGLYVGYGYSEGLIMGNVITGNTIENCGSGNQSGSGIFINSTGNAITGNTIKGSCHNGIGIVSADNVITGNTIRSDNFYGLYIAVGNNTITGNVIANNGETYGNSYGIYIGAGNNTITGNMIVNKCKNSSNLRCFGIVIETNDGNVITDNVIANDGTAGGKGECYGIGFGTRCIKNTITGNVIANRKTIAEGTKYIFALYFPAQTSENQYNCFHNNNLRGVTGASYVGSAYTEDGKTAKPLPGSATTVAAWGTGGSCGFNIV